MGSEDLNTVPYVCPASSLSTCFSHYAITVTRHPDKGNFYRREHVTGGLLFFRVLVPNLHVRKQAGIALEWKLGALQSDLKAEIERHWA